MKQDTLQHLLAKYQNGTISGEELQQLNTLSRRDEVLAAADREARGIIRRRTVRTVALSMTGLMVVGAGVWMLTAPQQGNMVAEVQPAPQITVVEPQPVAAEEPAAVAVESPAPVRKAAAKPATVAKQEADEPVVICNNQCDADSVISDIWKFLSA